jgi:F-type H+-transporting ATPase subunit gamma
LGEKGTAAVARPFPDLLTEAITEMQNPINFYNVSSLTNYILKSYSDFDEYQIMYNRFINTIQSKTEILKIMSKNQFAKRFNRLCTYDVSEPDSDVSMPYFYELYVASSFHYAMLQNAACEQSARMNAMENASKNAGEILSKLTLKYNKARQARITMELVEIISGASAL